VARYKERKEREGGVLSSLLIFSDEMRGKIMTLFANPLSGLGEFELWGKREY
jgi:hypothetical protein